MSAEVNDVVEHLFRQESGKLSASLTRAFGLARLDSVEDIVQDALLAALRNWSFRGVPQNPTAWLHRVARNKAVDRIRERKRSHEEALPDERLMEMLPGMRAATASLELERNFLSWEIEDSQLRMMFACCHPGIPLESQIALTLKTLCGFSVREIASAFFTKELTIEKRLGRARKYFRDHHVELEAPTGDMLHRRMDAVLSCLYLLFNEGYKRTDSDGLVQHDLCLEALRLTLILTEHPHTSSPEALALVALMTLIAARFETRTNERGNMVLLAEQDRSKWNAELIDRGLSYLTRSEPDIHHSSYHIEAAIQSLHITAHSFEETDWPVILGLYKRLYTIKPSPIVAMHMSVSMGHVHGAEASIALLSELPLSEYYLYHALLGDALMKVGRQPEAAISFKRALELTMNSREKALLTERLTRM
jgi:RNA polymerase sigma factor (sigma-70 family)